MAELRHTVRFDLKALGVEGTTIRSPLEDQALAVWRMAAHLTKVSSSPEQKRHGKAGRIGRFYMSDLGRQLFRGERDDEISRAMALVNQVLRKTQSTECLNRGKRGHPSTWWVSDTSPENLTVVVAHVKAQGLSPQFYSEADKEYRERKVTPEEAGETREPGQVTTLIAPEVDARPPRELNEGQRSFKAAAALRSETHLRRMGVFLDVLRNSDQPLVAFEVAWIGAVMLGETPPDLEARSLPASGSRNTGIHTRSLSNVRELLRNEAEAGRIFARKETKAERQLRFAPGVAAKSSHAWLYSFTDPVPERTVGQVEPEIPMLTGSAPGRVRKPPPPPPPPAKQPKQPPPPEPGHDEQLVLDTLRAANQGLSSAGHHGHSVAERSGLPVDRVRVALGHLQDRGVVFKTIDSSRWMLEAWRNRLRDGTKTDPPHAPAPQVRVHPADAPPVKPVSFAPAYPPQAVDVERLERATRQLKDSDRVVLDSDAVDQLLAQMRAAMDGLELLAEQPTGDSARVAELEAENAKLKGQVRALQKAISALADD